MFKNWHRMFGRFTKLNTKKWNGINFFFVGGGLENREAVIFFVIIIFCLTFSYLQLLLTVCDSSNPIFEGF